MTPSLEIALTLVRHGFAVFPVDAKKKPLVMGWTTNAAVNEGEVRRMWQKFPDAPCVGISTGQSGIVVLDFDPRNGSEETRGRWFLEHGDDWQRTVTAKTPQGGDHYYYRANGLRLKGSVCRLGPGVDVRAVGNFVVAPESIGEYGPYLWEPGHAPGDCDMAILPDWVASHANARACANQQVPDGTGSHRNKGDGVYQVKDIPYLVYPRVFPPMDNGRLRDIASDEAFALAAGQSMGARVSAVGNPFRCVLHDDNNPSAALYRDRAGVIVYRDWHREGSREEFLTLAEVFRAWLTGKPAAKIDGRSEHATWMLRLLNHMGCLDLAAVSMRGVPDDASRSVRKVCDGFRLLLGCKWTYSPGASTTFTRRFASDWCGVSESAAKKALDYLIGHGIIAQVDTCVASYGKEMALYLPA